MSTEPAESNLKNNVKAVSYPLRDAGGVIWADMAPLERMPDLPRPPITQVPSNQRLVIKRLQQSKYS